MVGMNELAISSTIAIHIVINDFMFISSSITRNYDRPTFRFFVAYVYYALKAETINTALARRPVVIASNSLSLVRALQAHETC